MWYSAALSNVSGAVKEMNPESGEQMVERPRKDGDHV